MLALSIFLLKLASPAATIVLRLAFLLSTVLAICGFYSYSETLTLLAFA
jgi:hypothetical protein